MQIFLLTRTEKGPIFANLCWTNVKGRGATISAFFFAYTGALNHLKN